MKCLCGFESDKKDFIELESIKILQPGTSKFYRGNDDGWVYACPECGTLKIEVPNDWDWNRQ